MGIQLARVPTLRTTSTGRATASHPGTLNEVLIAMANARISLAPDQDDAIVVVLRHDPRSASSARAPGFPGDRSSEGDADVAATSYNTGRKGSNYA